MRLLVFGIGNCGCRIAGEFSELGRKARSERRMQIITNTYAINNNQPELAQLKNSYRELQTIFVNRILEGNASAKAGAEIMREEGHRILTNIKGGDFYNTDAILLVAGAAGYFGSGGLPVMAQQLKDRHVGKPIYALLVLPQETEMEEPKNIINTAVCLNSTGQLTDAVLLVDNRKFKLLAEHSPAGDMTAINKEIVLPYYDLLCASEHNDPKFSGARSLGIGDMMQTLKGWTALGTGRTDFQVATKSFWKSTSNFQEKGAETQKAMEAMSLALGKLSFDFNLAEAHKAMYLLSVPAEGANINMVKAIGNRLLELTAKAEIRGGDFYGVKNCAQVTLLISDLAYVEVIKSYYDRAISLSKPPEPAKPARATRLEEPARATGPEQPANPGRKGRKRRKRDSI
jgi:cell division GTPase FtsZ